MSNRATKAFTVLDKIMTTESEFNDLVSASIIRDAIDVISEEYSLLEKIVSKQTKNYMNQHVAAAYLGVSPRTLEKWRLAGNKGPRYARLGDQHIGRVIYSQEALDEYVRLNTRDPK